MTPLRNSAIAALIAGVGVLGACGSDAAPASPPDQPAATAAAASAADVPMGARSQLGLMTSLPLYWPLGAEMAAIASGQAAVPWQRTAIEQAYTIAPLDTLSPIPALSPDAPDTDPLADLDRLAVIQPRGLSPADNVALDAWVRAGGRLLLMLDPALTGEYDLPLGDPRRPTEAALMPPVLARWGLRVSFDDAAEPKAEQRAFGAGVLPLALPGAIAVIDPAAAQCDVLAQGAVARCRVGDGQVTLIADAALFEHAVLAGTDGATLRAVLAEALR